MTNYEKEFQKADNVCGEPFEEIRTFLENWDRGPADLLDLGCGQGRDALIALRRGFRVTGVDIARTGVKQMVDQAQAEGMQVTGVVADIVTFEPPADYDVVLVDRVLHMLGSDEVRTQVLEKACRHTRPKGYVLVADTPANIGRIAAFFHHRDEWSTVLEKGNFCFVHKGENK